MGENPWAQLGGKHLVPCLQSLVRFCLGIKDGKHLYKPHFIKEHTEVPQKDVVCSRSLSELVTGQD